MSKDIKGVETLSSRDIFQLHFCIIACHVLDVFTGIFNNYKGTDAHRLLTSHLSSFTSFLSWFTSITALSLSVRSSTFMTGIVCQKQKHSSF